uniref:L1 transposable element RRM domain-containing protein n=1 Tax=Astyanax mexicanus TaxID=7994 RepID=A0A3B1KFA1_ASTMX
MADLLAESLEKQANLFQSQFEVLAANFKAQLSMIRDEFSAQMKPVLALISRVDSVLGEQREQKSVLNEHTSLLEAVEKKLADLEDCSRRNSVRLVGLPEGTEGSDPTGFIQKAIKEWFPTLATSEMEVERAHRVYRSQKDTRNSPRVFIFKLLRYQDRQRLLKASRASGPISHSGANLRFFVDYSSFTSKRRMAFLPVQKSLRAEGIESFLLYPAQLKVTISGTVHTFSSPKKQRSGCRLCLGTTSALCKF